MTNAASGAGNRIHRRSELVQTVANNPATTAAEIGTAPNAIIEVRVAKMRTAHRYEQTIPVARSDQLRVVEPVARRAMRSPLPE